MSKAEHSIVISPSFTRFSALQNSALFHLSESVTRASPYQRTANLVHSAAGSQTAANDHTVRPWNSDALLQSFNIALTLEPLQTAASLWSLDLMSTEAIARSAEQADQSPGFAFSIAKAESFVSSPSSPMDDSKLKMESRGLCPSSRLNSIMFQGSHSLRQSLSLFESFALISTGGLFPLPGSTNLEGRGEHVVIGTAATIALGAIGSVLVVAAVTIVSFFLFCHPKTYSESDEVSEMDVQPTTTDVFTLEPLTQEGFDSGSGHDVPELALGMEEGGRW
jgi:hypothetical protein